MGKFAITYVKYMSRIFVAFVGLVVFGGDTAYQNEITTSPGFRLVPRNDASVNFVEQSVSKVIPEHR